MTCDVTGVWLSQLLCHNSWQLIIIICASHCVCGLMTAREVRACLIVLLIDQMTCDVTGVWLWQLLCHNSWQRIIVSCASHCVCGVMTAREVRACLIVLLIALLATVHVQLFAVFYISTDTNGKSFHLIHHRECLTILEIYLQSLRKFSGLVREFAHLWLILVTFLVFQSVTVWNNSR